MLVDRGFRDVEGQLSDQGYQVFMPELLQGTGRQQFTSAEANASRQVTSCRWVIEAAFGRLKNVFKMFFVNVEATYNPRIIKFFRLAAAIMNAFYGKIFEDRDTDSRLAQTILARLQIENLLKDRIDTMGYLTSLRNVQWVKADANMYPDFPKLTWSQLEDITLGV